jgi:hypothetical protein
MKLSLNANKRTHEKHIEWRKRLTESIQTNQTSNIPNECKWLLYWNRKLLHQNPESYQEVEQDVIPLVKDAAYMLNADNKKRLRNAIKHRRGTKVRIQHHYRYLYHYTNYIHPLLLETGYINKAYTTIENYMRKNFNEVYDYRNEANQFQTSTVIRFLKAAKSVMIKIPDHLIGIFHQINDRLAQPGEPHPAYIFLYTGQKHQVNGQNAIAGVLLCQALGCCVYLVATKYDSENDRNFYRPEKVSPIDFTHWLGILKTRNIISLDQLIDYSFMYDKWLTKLGTPSYIQPNYVDLSEKMDEVEAFIEHHLDTTEGDI